MGLTKKFLVDTSNFEEITNKLRSIEKLPDKISTDFIEQLGYSNPPDFLILNFFKELNLLTEDNTPTALFKQFRKPQLSKETMAYGIVQAYGDLFERDPTIYERSKNEILEELKSHLGDEKSDLILRYMANTFCVLVDYVGRKQLESVLDEIDSDMSNVEKVVQEIAHKYRNGDTDIKDISSLVSDNENPELEKDERDSKESDSDRPNDNGNKSMKETKKDNPEDSIDTPKSSNSAPVNSEEQTGLSEDEQQSQKFSEHSSNKENTKPRISDNSSREFLNKAYIRKAALLQKLGRLEEALAATDDVYHRFASSEDPELSRKASEALINKMNIAEKLESDVEIIPIYTEVIDRLGSSEGSRFTDSVDHAFIQKAETLLKNSKNGDALEITEQAINRFKNTQRKQDFLAKMMFIKAEILEKTGSAEKALQAYDDFLNIFG